MWIDRRCYVFEAKSGQPLLGVLTLKSISHAARKTGNARIKEFEMDTMTGRKKVTRYQDEFESATEGYLIKGTEQEPRWEKSKS